MLNSGVWLVNQVSACQGKDRGAGGLDGGALRIGERITILVGWPVFVPGLALVAIYWTVDARRSTFEGPRAFGTRRVVGVGVSMRTRARKGERGQETSSALVILLRGGGRSQDSLRATGPMYRW